MKTIIDKCDEAIKWLDANQLGEVEEFNEKLKLCATLSSPSFTKVQVVCQEVCLIWVVWEVCQGLVELLLVVLEVPDPPLKRLINLVQKKQSRHFIIRI